MIGNAIYVTARALEWSKPSEDDWTFGAKDDADLCAAGIGGYYSATGPKPVAAWLKPKPEAFLLIDGVPHFRALLWWAHDPFSFTEFDSLEAAQLAAEADWQTRFRDLIASAPATSETKGLEQQ